MKPGAWAILQVPMRPGAEKTDEDISITDPRERERRFTDDHFRLYERRLRRPTRFGGL